jgi:3-oxoadipate enol-lactonase
MLAINFHNRGVGKSSRPNYPYTIDMFLSDIEGLLNHLNITQKIHLCGISMGGMIAQHFVLKYPNRVKTLVLCATSAKVDPKPIIEAQQLMENYDLEQKFKVMIAARYSLPFRKKLRKNKEIFEILRKDFTEDPTTVQDYINQAAATYEHDTRKLLHIIKHPTLIMVGDDDHVIPGLEHSQFLHENISNSRLEIIKGTGHSFVTEEPDLINDMIWSFIKEYFE